LLAQDGAAQQGAINNTGAAYRVPDLRLAFTHMTRASIIHPAAIEDLWQSPCNMNESRLGEVAAGIL